MKFFLIIIFLFSSVRGIKEPHVWTPVAARLESPKIRTQREVPHYNYFLITKQKKKTVSQE